MDIVDRVTDAEEILLQAKIDAARGVPSPPRSTCKVCGDTLPPERKKLSLALCFECASEEEARKQMYAR